MTYYYLPGSSEDDGHSGLRRFRSVVGCDLVPIISLSGDSFSPSSLPSSIMLSTMPPVGGVILRNNLKYRIYICKGGENRDRIEGEPYIPLFGSSWII